jgi:hypothetical protein
MLRSFFVTVSLTGLLLASGGTQAVASEATAASNIGFVLYTKSHAPGTLNARGYTQASTAGQG